MERNRTVCIRKKNNPNTGAKQSLSKGPSIFIWLTGKPECVTGSDEKCIWAGFLMRAGSGRYSFNLKLIAKRTERICSPDVK